MVVRRWLSSFASLRPRTRLLFGSIALGLACAAVQAGEPIDLGLKIAFDMARKHPVTTKALMVAIDDEAMRKLGPWPWPREQQAELLRRIDAAGAKRIFYDIILRDTVQSSDAELAQTLRTMRAPTYLAMTGLPDDSKQDVAKELPPPRFATVARLGTIAMRYNLLGYTSDWPTCVSVKGTTYQAFSVLLANRTADRCSLTSADYSADPLSVRRVSAAAFWSRQVPDLTGWDAVVGQDSIALSDQVSHPLIGALMIPGSVNLIAAADTYIKGLPVNLGCLPGLLIAVITLSAALRGKRSGRIMLLSTGAAVLLGSAFAARFAHLDTSPSAGLLAIGFAAVRIGLATLRRRSASTNLQTGLANYSSLANNETFCPDTLAIVVIGNYAEIVATITPPQEQFLQQQIIARLMIATGEATLYQGDDGSFAWFIPASYGNPDTLAGLYSLMLAPFKLGSRSIDLTLSIGIDSRTNKNSATRLGSAKAAAVAAAAVGERWREYDDRTTQDTVERLSMLGELDMALVNGQVSVAYQPQLNLCTNRIESAEALVRWTHPVRGEIVPSLFVELAERHGRIEKLTIRVLEQAIADAVSINRDGQPFRVAVNMSASLLDNKYLPEFTAALLRDAGLPPAKLMLEITETAAIDIDDPAIASTLNRYKEIGITLSLDDYGSGQSTLSYFKRVPADEIKIDRGFTSQISNSTADRLMITSTIKLAHELGRSVVAEGVEDAATLDLLRKLKCDTAQGYLIGKAMPLQELAKLITLEQSQAA